MNNRKDIEENENGYFSHEEISTILTAARGNFYHSVWFKLLYSLGVTISDLTKLKVEDIDLEKQIIVMKGNSRLQKRTLVIPKGLYEDIRLLVCHKKPRELVFKGRNGKVHPRTIQKVLEKLHAITGLKVNVTKLRKSVAVHLLQKGWDLKSISDFLGHKNTKATRILLSEYRKRVRNDLTLLDDLTTE